MKKIIVLLSLLAVGTAGAQLKQSEKDLLNTAKHSIEYYPKEVVRAEKVLELLKRGVWESGVIYNQYFLTGVAEYQRENQFNTKEEHIAAIKEYIKSIKSDSVKDEMVIARLLERAFDSTNIKKSAITSATARIHQLLDVMDMYFTDPNELFYFEGASDAGWDGVFENALEKELLIIQAKLDEAKDVRRMAIKDYTGYQERRGRVKRDEKQLEWAINAPFK